MVYAKKKKKEPRGKDTRRELQQPDEFMSVTDRVINAIIGQWKILAGVIGGGLVVFGSIAAYDAIRHGKEDAAAALLYDAELELPEAPQFDYMTGTTTTPDDQAERFREAVTHFDKIVAENGATVQGDDENLEAGNALFQAGDYEAAEQRYASAADSRSSLIKVLALNGQAKALESMEQFEREAEVLRQVVDGSEGALMEYAYLDLIRAHELKGDDPGALAVCREFEEKLPDSPLLDQVQNKIRAFGEEPADIAPAEEETGGETT